jgi:hypothetical protein
MKLLVMQAIHIYINTYLGTLRAYIRADKALQNFVSY